MGEKRSLRDRLFRKKPKEEQAQAALGVSSGESSLVPSLLSPEATRSATSVSLAESADTNASRRLSNEEAAAIGNEVNPEIESAERVVPIQVSNEADLVPAEPDTSSQQEQGAEVVAPVVSLWDQAYDALKESDEKLIKAYEDLLSRALLKQPDDAVDADNLIPQHNATARRHKMDDIIALGQKHADDKKISTTILGHEITIEKAIANTAGVVSWAEDYIKDAAKDLPYASIVIVGVSLVLPLLKNPVAVEEARNTGFTYVISQMRYYAAMEPLLVPEDTKPDLKADLGARLSQLYESIIKFQIQSVIHLYRSRTKNFFRGTINYDDWKGQLESIKAAEKALEAKFASAHSAQSLSVLKQMRFEAEQSRRQLDDTLSRITQILQDQLSVASRMDRRMADKEDRDCIDSLRADDPRYDKTRIESDKGGLLEDSYRWIFDNGSFQQWQSQAQALLWIRGDPGKGKTMLMCAIIDNLVRSASAYTSNVCYFFCQATQDRANNGNAVLRGLIYMLLKQQPALTSHLRELHDGIGARRFEGKNAWQALAKLFEQIATDAELAETYILIDGLDECNEELGHLLDLIVSLSGGRSRIKWVVSSRNEAPMTEKLGQEGGDVQLSLELNAESVSAAVSAYIDYKVKVLQASKKYSQSERLAVHTHLVENANATFLWVALVCQRLIELTSKQALREINKGIFPAGLPDFYERMLQRVDDAPTAETIDICKQTLAVVCTVYRPITLDELPTLICLPDEAWDDLDDLKDELSWCGSFLSLQKRVISVVHQSAVDFLLKQGAACIFPAGTKHTHHSIFMQSLQSMGNVLRQDVYDLVHPGYKAQDVQQPDPDPLAAVKYSAVYWVDHLEASEAASDEMQDAKLVLFFMQTKYLYWLEALSLLFKVPEGLRATAKLQRLLSTSQLPHLASTVWDADRFLRYFKLAIEAAPLQLYSSALLFAPTSSVTRNNFKKHNPAWVSLYPSPRADWDACMQILEGHTRWVNEVELFSDDQRAISHSNFGTIRIWDLITGACMQAFEPLEGINTSIVSHGNRAVFGSTDGTIQAWNIATGVRTHILEGGITKHTYVIFSSDGQKVACYSYHAFDRTIQVWDVATGVCTPILEEGSDKALLVVFSPDNQKLASWFRDPANRAVRIWDTATGLCTQTLEGYADQVEAVKFSPDNQHLLLWFCPSSNTTIQVRNIATGNCTQILQGHTGEIRSVAFSSDGQRAASTSADKTIRIWDVTRGVCVQVLKAYDDETILMVLSSDGEKVATATFVETIRIWDVAAGICTQTLEGHTEPITSLSFFSDGKRVISGSRDKTIRIWDVTTTVTTHMATHTPEGHTNRVTCVEFSPDGNMLVSASKDDTVRIWATTTCICTRVLPETGLFTPLEFSPDSQQLATLRNGDIQIWDVTTGVCVRMLKEHDYWAGSVQFSPNSQQLVSANDFKMRIWDVATGARIQALQWTSEILCWAISPDSQKIACCSGKTIQTWDITTGVCIQNLEVAPGLEITAVAVSTDGRKLAASCRYGDKIIQIWDAETLRTCIPPLNKDDAWIRSVVFSPDGQEIATTSPQATRIWDTASGACTLMLKGCIEPIPPAIFSTDRTSKKSWVDKVGCLRDCIVTVLDDWVFVDGNPTLWLPREYRTEHFAVDKSALALGCEYGQVCILRFR